MKTKLFKIALSIVIVGILFSYSGCEEPCGEDVLIGDLSLSSTSLEFLPYSDSKILVFSDSMGNEVILNSASGLQVSTKQLFFETLCFQRLLSSQGTYYNAESRSIQFTNYDSTITFDLSLEFETFGNDFSNPDSIYIYQSLFINSNSQGSLMIMTDQENDFPQSSANQIQENFVFLDSLTFFNATYFDVYMDAFQDPAVLYYNRKFGIVAFTDSQGVRYVLEEIRG